MSCTSPLLAIPEQVTDRGYPVKGTSYKIIGKYTVEVAKNYENGIKLPCGQCLACKKAKCREWADRMILELDHSKKAVFLTLTYNDDSVPILLDNKTGEMVLTLCKRHLQNFMKRLRKHFKDKELRFYACGEYGSHTDRPHYHVILFGLSLEDFNFNRIGDPEGRFDITGSRIFKIGVNDLGQEYYGCDWLADVWSHGFVCLSKVSWKTCAYVARYVKKKETGLYQDALIEKLKEPEYSVMSRNPGIGMYYPEEHPDVINNSIVYLSDHEDLITVRYPSIFMNWLYDHDREIYNELKNERRKFNHDKELNDLFQTDLFSDDLYELENLRLNDTSKVIDFYRGL